MQLNKNLEYTDCNFCGSKLYSIFLISPKAKDHNNRLFSTTSQAVAGETVVRCISCGLIYVNPRPKKSKILTDYSKAKEDIYINEKEARMKTFKNSLKIIQKYKKTGVLLDVGCAAGFFLKVVQRQGFEVYGIEPNKWLADWGRKNLKLNIASKSFEESDFPKDFFDVVTFWDVLEHTINPLETLEKTNRVLKKGGILMLNYPDINSLPAKIFGKHWWFIISNHLFYFTPDTISKMLKKTGFEIIENHVHFQKLSVAYLLTRLGRYNINLAKKLSDFSLILGFGNFLIPYYAGQKTVIAIKQN